MSHTLSHTLSPLEQTRKNKTVKLANSSRQLNAADQATLKRVLTDPKLDYVANDIFAQKDAAKVVFDDAPPIRRPDTSWYHPLMENLSTEHSSQNSAVLLTAKEEQALFLQFNYCRYMVVKLREQIDEQNVDPKLAQEMLHWHRRAEGYRDQIAQTNLALVLAMAKRTRMSEVDFADLVSEGNMALLRAVDKFDVARGFKFSTYACRAILKAFSRLGVKTSKYRKLFPTDFDPNLERSNWDELKRAEVEDECVDEVKNIFRANRAELSDIEQEVIEHRFGLALDPAQQKPDSKPLTLEQVGKIIGVTKERVRQIQNKALDKMRETLEEEYLT